MAAVRNNIGMTTHTTLQWGWRRGQSAVLLGSFVLLVLTTPGWTQNEAKERTDKAIQPAQTQLRDDQPRLGQSPAASEAVSSSNSASQPNEADIMKQMLDLSKLNENHKLLSSLDGNWQYTLKMSMSPDPNAKPQESKGTATRKSLMGGRYVVMDVSGSLQMPGADGKMQNVSFKGMGIEGYDNVKKKFVASWIDSMGTGIAFSEGTYDPSTKSFTYRSEMEPVPGMKTRVREVVKLIDNNHMALEWYEEQGGSEKKTMEINYARRK